MVPAPPVPAVAVAEMVVPLQTAPVAIEGVRAPETGIALIVQLTVTGAEVKQPAPVVVLYV